MATCVDCEAGWYCSSEAKTRFDKPCPMHYYCEARSYSPTPCSTGTWQPKIGSSSCEPCPRGFFCDETVFSIPAPPPTNLYPKPCDIGKYCPEGATEQETCPSGKYGTREQLESVDGCEDCPAGYFCVNGTMEICEAGYYCTGGADDQYKDNFYIFLDDAPIGSQTPHYTGNAICPDGHYCPIGSEYPTPCPPGTYNTESGRSEPTFCFEIDNGRYISTEGTNDPDAASVCDDGFYCQLGAKTARPNDTYTNGRPCTKGHMCIEGNQIACGVNEATFQNNDGQFDCTICPEGYSCSSNVGLPIPTACAAGSFCNEGVANPANCPVGYFNPHEYQSEVSSCFPCLPGSVCDDTNVGRINGKDCDGGYYCGPGLNSTDEQVDCPAGYYCPQGSSTTQPCNIGTYTDETLEENPECKNCLPGEYCSIRGLPVPDGNCSAGYFCPDGANLNNPKPGDTGTDDYICPVGYECPEHSPEPIPCGPGTYQPNMLRGECLICPAGFYCPDRANTDIIKCTSNNYCEAGSSEPSPCPDGTLSSDETVLISASECIPCPTGKYCRNGEIRGDCDEGYFCLAGADDQTPNNDFFADTILGNDTICDAGVKCQGRCPPGHYCPTGGTELPIPCSQNTYMTRRRGIRESQCDVCPPGAWCQKGQGEPDFCPQGYFCNAGIGPGACPSNTFNNETGLSEAEECTPCSAGFDCTELGMRQQDNYECPPGYYCEGNNEPRKQCPPRHYRDESGGSCAITNTTCDDGCAECPQGTYCPEDTVNDGGLPCPPGITCDVGTEEPNVNCPAGYYCPEASYEIPCRAGYYCPIGSWNETVCEFPYYCPERTGENYGMTCNLGYGAVDGFNRTNEEEFCRLCPSGTYRSREEQVECEPCPAGSSCPEGTGRDNTAPIPCPIGHYCPTGYAPGVPIPCGVGTYSSVAGAEVENCQECPENTYAHLEGQAACRRCGTASLSLPGASQCQCLGTNRIFQYSDGACICRPGYESSGYEGADATSANTRQDCLPMVNERCPSGSVRDSATRKCISLAAADEQCAQMTICDGARAEYDRNYGNCLCPINKLPEEIPNCCDIELAELNKTTGQLTIQGEVIENVYGLDETVIDSTNVFSLRLNNDGIFGVLPVAEESRRKRRQAILVDPGETIQNPTVCLMPGEMVIFDLVIDDANRIDSVYPKYQVKDGMNSANI